MGQCITVQLDEDLVAEAQQHAQNLGISFSRLVEESLIRRIEADAAPSFSTRWRGKFQLTEREGARYRALTDKYS